MSYEFVIWRLDDDDESNVEHVGQHGVTRGDVQDVLDYPERIEKSRSSDNRIAFGLTRTGRELAVVFEEIDEMTAQIVTAYFLDDRP